VLCVPNDVRFSYETADDFSSYNKSNPVGSFCQGVLDDFLKFDVGHLRPVSV
jgi:hypothetical protein